MIEQLHVSLCGRSARLTSITGYAGADHIFPEVFTTPIAGNDVVQGKLAALLAAVLAGKVVAVENLKAGQLALGAGDA